MKYMLDIFGNKIYPGNVMLGVSRGELTPLIFFGFARGKRGLFAKCVRIATGRYWGTEDNFKKANIPSSSIIHKYSWTTNSGSQVPYVRAIYSIGVDAQYKFIIEDKEDYFNQSIVAISNPLFNLGINGMAELMNLAGEAVEGGYLPKGYKLGDRIVFDGLVRKGNARLYVEGEDEDE